MSRARQAALLVGGLALVALVAYMADRTRPLPGSSQQPRAQAGLAWLPAEAALVGAVNLAGLREQAWLLDSVERATGEVTQESSYRAFVEATGFDYTRDLEQVWIALFGGSEPTRLAGVAQGRFAQARILAYARQQGATLHLHQGFEIYEWRLPPAALGQSESNFAVAFLDNTHLAFASDRVRAIQVIECWLDRAPAVATEEQRRAEIARLASAHQAWAVVYPARWSHSVLGVPMGQTDIAAVMVQLALGLTVGEQGVELVAEARCQEPRQAQRLRDNLRVMILAGRMALAREKDETSQALREALADLSLEQREDRLEARVSLAPRTVAALLRAAPTTAQQH